MFFHFGLNWRESHILRSIELLLPGSTNSERNLVWSPFFKCFPLGLFLYINPPCCCEMFHQVNLHGDVNNMSTDMMFWKPSINEWVNKSWSRSFPYSLFMLMDASCRCHAPAATRFFMEFCWQKDRKTSATQSFTGWIRTVTRVLKEKGVQLCFYVIFCVLPSGEVQH